MIFFRHSTDTHVVDHGGSHVRSGDRSRCPMSRVPGDRGLPGQRDAEEVSVHARVHQGLEPAGNLDPPRNPLPRDVQNRPARDKAVQRTCRVQARQWIRLLRLRPGKTRRR